MLGEAVRFEMAEAECAMNSKLEFHQALLVLGRVVAGHWQGYRNGRERRVSNFSCLSSFDIKVVYRNGIKIPT